MLNKSLVYLLIFHYTSASHAAASNADPIIAFTSVASFEFAPEVVPDAIAYPGRIESVEIQLNPVRSTAIRTITSIPFAQVSASTSTVIDQQRITSVKTSSPSSQVSSDVASSLPLLASPASTPKSLNASYYTTSDNIANATSLTTTTKSTFSPDADLVAIPSSSSSSELPLSSVSGTNGTCPVVWTAIAADLRRDFAGCNQLATNAIRFAFHDAAGYAVQNGINGAASGGADGSLLLNDTEIARSTENPMQNFHEYLLTKYNLYKAEGASAADFVQFAGSLGVTSCPGGPVYKTVVGRFDDSSAAPDGTLPAAFGPNATYDLLIQLWADKGFGARELAALMGAHSLSRAFAQEGHGIPPGGPQDTSPRSWDTTYFSQTQAETAPRGVYRFDSDVNLARANTTSGQAFTEFAGSRDAWRNAFIPAMYKLSILGIPEVKVQDLVDCTAVVSSGAVAAKKN